MANQAQRSFARGEIAPALYARTDQVAYATGLRTCRNFRVLKSGGVENRPGTQLVGACPTGSVVRILPFVFNDAQTYVLEFSAGLLRFARLGAYIMSGGVPFSIITPYQASELATLQITQSADVVTIVHPNHPPMNLSRTGDTAWSLSAITFAPAVPSPVNVHLDPAEDPGATFLQWGVTAIDGKTGQESYLSAIVGVSSIDANVVKPHLVTWTAVPGASAYNIYKGSSNNGTIAVDLGFIGSTGTNSFYDDNLTPDALNRAPVPRNPFASADQYPGAVGYYQGRRTFGGSNSEPETIWTSRSADYNNFTVSTPSQDDDAITFTLVGRTVNRIKHLVDHATLMSLTSGAEWTINGDQSGVLRPSDVNALNFSEHGSSDLRPIRIDRRLLYVQARGAKVVDIAKDPWYGFKGNDLTVMSTHLFEGHTLVDWAYQEMPHSIVWIVRDDGTLLGLTDVDEQQMLAWHRHDTLGTFENVCVVPEGAEDAVYVVVNRNGVRYLERFASRFVDDVEDAILTDATLSYDGRNTDPTNTLTLSGGSDWAYDHSLTLTASASEFVSGDVGNQYVLTGSDGSTLRFRVTAYTNATTVSGFPQKTVPVSLQGIATHTWARAVDQVAGLDHLEGQAVAVFADGYVVASPNNPAYTRVVVSGGIATLDQPYGYIHVGLPFVSDLETLDIDTPQGSSLKDTRFLINRLTLLVAASRGVFAGDQPPADDSTGDLIEYKLRDQETYGVPVSLATGDITVNINGGWQTGGRVFVRQVDPVPLTILGAIPAGSMPGGR